MFITTLKRLTVFIFILGSALFAKAQQAHFVYLQTENGGPFYVKLNNKVVSSSSAGYLIIPKLSDGDYKLNVGFPKNEFPEEKFKITIDNKNEGFLLKNFGEKGWGLFNMQSLAVIMGEGTNTSETVSKNPESDPFSKMLANVVKDSSILQKNEPVQDVVPAPTKMDSVAAIAQPEEILFSPAKKWLSKKNKDGMEMVYIDPVVNGNDTIRIFIPIEKEIIKTDTTYIVQTQNLSKPVIGENASVKDTGLIKDNFSIRDTSSMGNSKQESKVNTDTTASVPPLVSANKSPLENKNSVIVKNDEEEKQKNEEVKQPEISQPDSTIKKDKKHGETKKDELVVLPEVVKSSTTNSDCKVFADNKDFLILRKKMASENSDDNMIKIAKKAFHSKCFSTEQIKNLSFLFLTNEGKYRFFDEAYAFASDSDQYYTLQSQFTDSYYANRFRAMIHK
jgi:hypothetical protein